MNRFCNVALGIFVVLAAMFDSGPETYAGKKVDVTEYVAEKGVHVTRIEEHWKVRVAYPDPANATPEFLFVLSPTGHFDGQHMVLALNHSSEPNFKRGGVELQAYNGSTVTNFQQKLPGSVLSETDDDIEVKMAMSLADGRIHYEVFKLKGKTWDDNKGERWLHVSQPTNIEHFDNYDAAVTHTWTGAAAGVHTLEKVEVTKVRYTFSDGKDIDVDEYKTKIEYQPSVVYKTYDEYKASLEQYQE